MEGFKQNEINENNIERPQIKEGFDSIFKQNLKEFAENKK